MDVDSYSELKRKSKWLGIIDYKSLIILIAYLYIIWSLFGFFIHNIIYRVYFLVIFSIPVLGLFYSHRSSDNISEVIYSVIKFTLSPKLYVQSLENENNFENCCKL